MAKVRSNPIVEGLSGKLGDQLVFRHLRDGRTILCAKPDFSRRKLSAKQKAHHAKFKAGAAYARDAAQRQPVYAELAAGTMKNAYNIVLADWFHAPRIGRIDLKNGLVRIQAVDNVRVAGVKVAVLNEQGMLLERGEAMQVDELWWSYTPQKPLAGNLKIEVEAHDLAGNVTKESKMFG